MLLKMLQLCYCEGKIFHFQQVVCVCARVHVRVHVCVHFGFLKGLKIEENMITFTDYL